MTVRDDDGTTREPTAAQAPGPGDPRGPAAVAGLLSALDGLDRLPLKEQAERLETVRKGLDEALAHPVVGTAPPAAGHG